MDHKESAGDQSLEDGIVTLVYSFILFTLIHKLGTGYGIIVFLAFLWVKTWILEKLMGVESLSSMDYIFLYDSNKARANVMGKYHRISDIS